ncbi:TPA: hypothetical protein N0F65_011029 [Lagenidium giganteum]|uniref:protein-tyrosine-phosphatase n=1 Tax=Lagenidium giganteum TaxID=4803 RepID=A0AAV2Z769_9STRA|nr:TPA: hypothetical protein N0F65_011029 [Lagenidium giganteum]
MASDPATCALLKDRISVLPGRLDFAVLPTSASTAKPLTAEANTVRNDEHSSDAPVLLCVDDDLVYARFFADFGPLNLAQTVRFCRRVDALLNEHAPPRVILCYSSEHPHKRANVMALLVLYLVLRQQHSPEQAWRPFKLLPPPFGFRDAACGICTYFISVLDCAKAVAKAVNTHIWSYDTFSLEDYEHDDLLEHGDMNWLLPGKLLAFSGPQRQRVALDHGRSTLLAEDYAKLFKHRGITCVVRFNEASTYDRRAFVNIGIRHLDMEYADGGVPSDDILNKFLRTVAREPGAVAVHCKAGLGRTGTHIAAYLMLKHRFSAAEAIAWCRICRPGSIVGPQQHFLQVKQRELWESTDAAMVHAQDGTPFARRQAQLQHARQADDAAAMAFASATTVPPPAPRASTPNKIKQSSSSKRLLPLPTMAPVPKHDHRAVTVAPPAHGHRQMRCR